MNGTNSKYSCVDFRLHLLQQATHLRLTKGLNFSYVQQKCKVVISIHCNLYFTTVTNPLPYRVTQRFFRFCLLSLLVAVVIVVSILFQKPLQSCKKTPGDIDVLEENSAHTKAQAFHARTHRSFTQVMLVLMSLPKFMSFVVVQSLGHVWLFVTPWTTACQASLSYIISGSLLRSISIESVMLSNHLTLCSALLLLPSNFPSIRVFSNESAFHIRWLK